MTIRQILIIGNTWEFASRDSDQFSHHFYSRLFQLAPGLREDSPSSVALLSRKLSVFLNYVVSCAPAFEDSREDLERLARRHDACGLMESHYNHIGASLLWSLRRVLGVYWNEEVNAAWTYYYKIVSSVLIESVATGRQQAA